MVKKKVVVGKKELSEAIQKVVKNILSEGAHFSAMRSIEHMAASTSMEFEKNIVDQLGLAHPDMLPPELQTRYYEVVTRMRDGIKTAVLDAAKEMISFPRKEEKGK